MSDITLDQCSREELIRMAANFSRDREELMLERNRLNADNTRLRAENEQCKAQLEAAAAQNRWLSNAYDEREAAINRERSRAERIRSAAQKAVEAGAPFAVCIPGCNLGPDCCAGCALAAALAALRETLE